MDARRAAGCVGVRPRALDTSCRLAILRSVDELSEDATVSRAAAHSHVALDRENEEVCISSQLTARSLPPGRSCPGRRSS